MPPPIPMESIMEKIEYKTGRFYDTEQVLIITEANEKYLKFEDASRNLTGYVEKPPRETSRYSVGAYVLAKYDNCEDTHYLPED